ncbi:MAG: hypothetical protein FWF78_05435 [Defluviitaleaceae bacterium]|nr:hypothetical protein [Defluviitaleaceae bacterium]
MLSFVVVIPILIAVLLFIFSTNTGARILAIVMQTVLFGISVWLVFATRTQDIVTYVGSEGDALGIVLRANTLSSVFILLTTFIFLAAAIYTYKEERDMRTFWFLLFLLEASFVGLFLTNDLFNIFVLVEVSTLVTVILTLFDRKQRNMFYGKVFLMANVVAAQFYLLGLAYVYRFTGVLDIYRVTEAIAHADRANLVLPYVLIMTTIAFKCTLIPFFSWTPKAKIYPLSPTIVAAILSGLQAKTAIYLFLRIQEVFAPVAATEFFIVIGIIAGVFGAFMAICQTNIKMILAYHTVSQVGLIIIGVSSDLSYIGGLYHIVSHAMFKTTLFLGVGIIFHSYGTGNVYKIRGVFRRMPVVSIGMAAAVLGIVGAPFFIGSVSKYFLSYDVPLLMNMIFIIISLGTIISFIKFSGMFFGKLELRGDIPIAEGCRTVPVVIMGAICLVGGIFGPQMIYILFRYSVTVDFFGYVQKSLIFFGSLVVGYAVYKFAVNEKLKNIGDINFSFKSICASLGVFFGIMLLWVG